MSLTFHAFSLLCFVTGAAAWFVFMLWGLGWCLVKAWRYLKVWHTLSLIVAIKLHGKNHNDRLFWQALKEHINGNPFAAKTVADFARSCAPFNEDTTI